MFKTLLSFIIYITIFFTVQSSHININYSFKLPEVFGEGNVDNSNCCPYIVYSHNVTNHKRAPDFIIIGVQKSGTTELAAALSKHPLLVKSKSKELHWLDGDGIS